MSKLEKVNLLTRSGWQLTETLPAVPLQRQSIPREGLFSATWRDFISVKVWIGLSPEFSAKASGIDSNASANARNGYCSKVLIYGKKRTHSVPFVKEEKLFNRVTHRIGFLGYRNRTGDFGSSASVHNAVISNQIANNAESIMNTTLGFFNNLETQICQKPERKNVGSTELPSYCHHG